MERTIAEFGHSGSPDSQVSEREHRNRALARRAAAARLISIIWRTSAYENAVPYGKAAK